MMTVTVIYKMNILTEVYDKEIVVIFFIIMLIANFLVDDNN